jgi:hypothetical protein
MVAIQKRFYCSECSKIFERRGFCFDMTLTFYIHLNSNNISRLPFEARKAIVKSYLTRYATERS